MAPAERRPPGGGVQIEVADSEPRSLTTEERTAFLDYVREHQDCSVREACVAVGLKRRDVRALRRTEPEFDHDYREARGYGVEQIQSSIRKLAIEGVEKPLVSAGKLVRDENGEVVVVREYSEKLLELMARMHLQEAAKLNPSKVGVEITGADGGPIKIQQGVSLESVVAVLRQARALPELEEEPAGELVAETDEEISE